MGENHTVFPILPFSSHFESLGSKTGICCHLVGDMNVRNADSVRAAVEYCQRIGCCGADRPAKGELVSAVIPKRAAARIRVVLNSAYGNSGGSHALRV